ncbi:MAG: efflux RND transporter periplasmic adaptor subunit [Planctomycetota bacterium]
MSKIVLLGVLGVLCAGVVGVGWRVVDRLGEEPLPGFSRDPARRVAVPVEVAPVELGPIERRRVFNGTLEASHRMTIAPKIAGRVRDLAADLADTVEHGQVVVELDSEEYAQALAEAEAELAVAEASLAESKAQREIAKLEYERILELIDRGVATDFELETARVELSVRQAIEQGADAGVKRAEAAVEGARIRLGYTVIRATWEDSDGTRVVSRRLVSDGVSVSAISGLLELIELDPIEAVITVSEQDYAQLEEGQLVRLRTDAFGKRVWEGQVSRVSPVFRVGSRQADVEVLVDNAEGLLKPGMFARIEAVLDRRESALVVPAAAVVRRNGLDVVFVLSDDTNTVRMVEVEIGIESDERVEIISDELGERVVTLGQQLLDDGVEVSVTSGAEDADGGAG